MPLPISIESHFPVRDLGEALHQRLKPSRSGAIAVTIEGGW